MHLTVIITAMAAGGMERFAATLCNTLALQNRNVLLCALHPPTPDASSAWLDQAVQSRVLNRRARHAGFKLIRLCREHPEDPVLALGLEIAVVLVLLKNFRLIRNPVFYRESTDVRSHLNPAWTRRIRRLLPRLDGLFVQSRTVEQDLHALSPAFPPVRRIGNPCPWLSDPSPGFTLRTAAPGFPALLCVARLEPIKGHNRLIEVFPEILKAHPRARLRLLGGGSQKEALQTKIKTAGLENQIAITGFQSNPKPAYQDADVVIIPSDYEGFPNVIAEALSCGCRLLCADAPGGIREIFDHLGLETFLVSLERFQTDAPGKLSAVLQSPADIWETARDRMAAICAPEKIAESVWRFVQSERENMPS